MTVSSQIGQRAALHGTGVSKAILAFMTPEEQAVITE